MILIYLLAAHFLCDYPLQGDFLARAKNRVNPVLGVPWYQCLVAHAFIHGAAVALITSNLALGFAEFVVHFVVDDLKCAGYLGTGERAFNIDQAIHAACKLMWFGLMVAA